ncbi:hypothetical protein FRB96_008143 [Tulasnella sp. 330]|nr:hypothetical protein FRB96_008143 [Tulasnella sp. 330]KAG8877042.1 hypothetical protein FRB97_003756 [Tulasnella sp. 331]KAG8877319.1 hypothetical protein FRB98_006754 [Tulasnella sp. 332]
MSEPFKRHPVFYYPDGNICLVAENTIFRLLKSQLSQNSNFFTDLFELSATSNEAEEYEGATIIRVSDVPEDLVIVFTLLWCGPRKPLEFTALCRVLEISTKYIMEDIREWCISELKEKVFVSSDKDALGPLAYYAGDSRRPGQVIQLARKCDVPELLPLAFYALATSIWTRTSPALVFADVEHADLVRVLVGKEKLHAFWKEFRSKSEALGLDLNTHPCVRSASSSPCGVGKESTLPLRREAAYAGTFDPLKYLLNKSTWVDQLPMCMPCAWNNRTLCEATSQKIFSQLHTIFDLPVPPVKITGELKPTPSKAILWPLSATQTNGVFPMTGSTTPSPATGATLPMAGFTFNWNGGMGVASSGSSGGH